MRFFSRNTEQLKHRRFAGRTEVLVEGVPRWINYDIRRAKTNRRKRQP